MVQSLYLLTMKREKISEILAKARIQASMDEPTRPTTPMAKMNNKMPEYVPPLTHIATMKRLKVKSPVNTPHEKKRLDNMSSGANSEPLYIPNAFSL